MMPSVVDEVEPGVFRLFAPWMLADVQRYSEGRSGSFWCASNGSVVHHISNHNVQRYVLDADLPGLRQARRVVSEMIGSEPGWSYAQMSRLLTDWLSVSQSALTIQIVPVWHYQRCLPCNLDCCSMEDLRSAYWQCLRRCPSPLVEVDGGRLLWRAISAEKEVRWNQILTVLESLKSLRLAFIGVNAAGWRLAPPSNGKGTVRVANGCIISKGNPVGRLNPVTSVVVRCVYEVVQVQAESADTVYSNADCCLIDNGASCSIWDDCGLDYRSKARGVGSILAIGHWRVGECATEHYTNDQYDVPCGMRRRVHEPFQSVHVVPRFYQQVLLGVMR